jgi:hypothetical protein
MIRLALLLSLTSHYSVFSSDTTHKDFYWGANGHPLNQEAYLHDPLLQIKALKEAGLGFYRFDVPHDDQGKMIPANEGRLDQLAKIAADSGITLVPVIYLEQASVLYTLSPDTAYDKGLIAGKGFASMYGRYFSYYELGNENDREVLIPPAGDGDDSGHYDLQKVKILAAYLRGMSDGIRQVDGRAKLIISNAGWKHYLYFDLLEKEGVVWDIIGYHWYEDPFTLRLILRILRNSFADKRVWFTEINCPITGADPGKDDLKDMRKNIRSIRNMGRNVDAFFIYELFDEPAQNGGEGHFGLYSWPRRYDSLAPKPLLGVLRKAEAERPRE